MRNGQLNTQKRADLQGDVENLCDFDMIGRKNWQFKNVLILETMNWGTELRTKDPIEIRDVGGTSNNSAISQERAGYRLLS